MMKEWLILGLCMALLSSPIYASAYTPTSETSCIGTICQIIQYSSVRFVYDKEWIPIEQAASLMPYYSFYYKEKDASLGVKVLDFNYTHIKLSLNASGDKLGKAVPLEIYKDEQRFDGAKIVLNKTQKTLVNYNFASAADTMTVTLPYTFGYDVKLGTNSTVITLNESNNGTMADTHLAQYAATTNYGSATGSFFRARQDNNIADWHIIRINTTSPTPIPAGASIINATMYTFMDTLENCGGSTTWIGWDNTTNNLWVESTITWNSGRPGRSMFLNETNKTVTTAMNGQYIAQNITTFFKDAYAAGTGNLSLMMTGKNESDNCDLIVSTKEDSNVAQRPYYAVWYDVSMPTNTSLWIDGTSANATSACGSASHNYTGQVNVTGLNITLLLNGTPYCTNTTSCYWYASLIAGYWNITANTSGNASFSASSKTLFHNITLGTPSVDITTNATGNQSCIGSAVSITCNSTDLEDGVLLYNGTSALSQPYSFTPLSAGTINYTCNWTVGDCYNAGQKTLNLTVADCSPNTTNITNLCYNIPPGAISALSCFDSGTLSQNWTLGNESCVAYSVCANGCDNVTSSCAGPKIQTDLINVGIIVIIFMGVVAFAKFLGGRR